MLRKALSFKELVLHLVAQKRHLGQKVPHVPTHGAQASSQFLVTYEVGHCRDKDKSGPGSLIKAELLLFSEPVSSSVKWRFISQA